MFMQKDIAMWNESYHILQSFYADCVGKYI